MLVEQTICKHTRASFLAQSAEVEYSCYVSFQLGDNWRYSLGNINIQISMTDRKTTRAELL